MSGEVRETPPAHSLTGAILFDLDGTLTDPFEGITKCIEHALDRLGVGSRSPEELAACIGPPLRGSFAQFLETHDPLAIERAMTLYRERFAVVGMFENQVYAGVPEMLEQLGGRGYRLYVATSKPRVFAEQILQHFALAHHFAAVYGSELDGRYDNKAELVAHLLLHERLQPEATVMVGDRRHDIAAAKDNGLRSIGVTYGYGTAEELSQAGADILCHEPAAIARIVQA